MKKITVSLMLCVALLVGAITITSCGDTTPAVMTLDGHTVTAAMYHYWASSSKGSYIAAYEDVVNTEEYWNSELTEGKSAAEYFDELTLDSIKSNLVGMKLFDDYGLSFEKSEKSGISDYVKDLVKEYGSGSKSTMNAVLGEYGINLSLLQQIYIEEAKTTKVYRYLYGEGGAEAATDSELEQYYQDFFVHFQLIYINNAYQYVTDSEGNKVTNDDGYYKTEELEASVKAEKDAAVAAARDAIAKGEDFDSVYQKYSEFKMYDGGYYYSASQQYSDITYYQFVKAVSEVEVGEIAFFENDAGAYIMKRLSLDEGAWKKSENSDFFPTEGNSTYRDSVNQYKFREKIKSCAADIVVDEEAIKEFSVATVTPCYSF